MKNETTNIVIIDDILSNKDMMVREIRYNYENVSLLNSVKEGIEYIENNLDKRNIILLDYQFSTAEPKGDYVLQELRKKTKIIPVILMTANYENIDNYNTLINNKVFALIDDRSDYKLILQTIRDAEQTLEIDIALQDWINLHPDIDKVVYISSENKSYSLKDILKEIRLQTETGKEFSNRLTKLTIDLLMRNKESLND